MSPFFVWVLNILYALKTSKWNTILFCLTLSMKRYQIPISVSWEQSNQPNKHNPIESVLVVLNALQAECLFLPRLLSIIVEHIDVSSTFCVQIHIVSFHIRRRSSLTVRLRHVLALPNPNQASAESGTVKAAHGLHAKNLSTPKRPTITTTSPGVRYCKNDGLAGNRTPDHSQDRIQSTLCLRDAKGVLYH